MTARVVVLSFDRLHLGFLGCYGNDWMETPNLDRLATQAVLFDRHFCENLDPAAVNHAWWTGRYQCRINPEQQRAEQSFLPALEQAGVRAALLVEADSHGSGGIAPPFEEIVEVRGADQLEGPESEAPFARLVLRAIEWLEAAGSDHRPHLLWLKSRGVPNPWLPPGEFADLYLDEFGLGENSAADAEEPGVDDEEPPAHGIDETSLAGSPAAALHANDAVPASDAAPESDACLELRYARALYAAYVSWLDRWTGKLLQFLEREPGWDQTLLIVTAAGGESLGEHGPLGERPQPLREELVHTPLFLRIPDHRHHATRRPALVQPVDLAPTILDWFGVCPATGDEPTSTAEGKTAGRMSGPAMHGRTLLPVVRSDHDAIRSAAMLHAEAEWGLRTDDFFYIESKEPAHPGEPAEMRLYEKPHDRWEQAELSAQYPQAVEELRDRLNRLRTDPTADSGPAPR
jgi:arylsulfatase A-like enzyme